MKYFIPILTASLAVNVILASLHLKAYLHDEASPTTRWMTNADGVVVSASLKGPSITPGSTNTTSARRASWNDLRSDNLKEFVRRLRAAGCPEQTVRDIISAEVGRLYSLKKRVLWPDRKKAKPYWEAENPVADRSVRAQWREDRRLEKEKQALLVELLGVDPEAEARKAEGLDDPPDWQAATALDYLPESKREAVSRYLEEFEDRMQDFNSTNQGLWDAQFRAEQKQLEEERTKGLAEFLTPQELREYELRSSALAHQLSFELRDLSSITREQFEAIYDIRKKYGDSVNLYGGDPDPGQAAQLAEANKKAMKADLNQALGADLAKTYNRSQDYSYLQLNRLAIRNDLPADTATKIYDFKDAAKQSLKQLQANTNLTPEQRQQAQQAIVDETTTAVKTALGEKTYKRYLNNGGWWLNSLNP